MRKAPRSHFDISATETSKDKGFLFHCISKPETRNVKSAQEPFRHFSYRDFKGQRVSLPLHFENPETQNAKSAQEFSTFRLPGLQRTWGLSLSTAFRKLRNPEMRKAPRSHFDISATGPQKTWGLSLCIQSQTTLHGRSS
jgi:hypothetical protein